MAVELDRFDLQYWVEFLPDPETFISPSHGLGDLHYKRGWNRVWIAQVLCVSQNPKPKVQKMTNSNGYTRGGAAKTVFKFSGLARLYANARVKRLGQAHPASKQAAVLKKLVRRAQFTKFGQAHGFEQTSDVQTYQRRVPVREYNEFWADWWQPTYPDLIDQTWPGRIPYFSMTSGTTTGRSKFIPYTPEMKRAATRGFLDLLCFHFTMRPESRVLDGDVLGLTGPTDLDRAAPGVESGAVSAITVGGLPSWIGKRVLPPPELANISNWEEKIRRLAPLSLERDIRILGGSPNWLLIFLQEVARQDTRSSSKLVDWFPNLELIVHGGVNFAPYRQRFASLMEKSHAETREMYSASEGVFAYADRGDGEGMRLHLDGQIFFEFVPIGQLSSANPERHWVANIQQGVDYAIVVSTAAGLWSYVVGDVVRFVDLSPPRLLVVGRVENSLSAFGEHLIEDEIAGSVAAAASQLCITLVDYCVGPVARTGHNHHLYLVEPSTFTDPMAEDKLAKAIDANLRARNDDYNELRKNNLALGAPEVRLVPPGQFLHWMKTRRGLGGQYKVPRIVSDNALFEDMCETVLSPQKKEDPHEA